MPPPAPDGLRRFVLTRMRQYVLLYRVRNGRIEVIAVRDTRRDNDPADV